MWRFLSLLFCGNDTKGKKGNHVVVEEKEEEEEEEEEDEEEEEGVGGEVTL